jgi:TM2 domain-containing membrane protein YozV
MPYCRNCAKEVGDKAVICVGCGTKLFNGKKYCQNCGSETDALAETCIKCGVKLADEAPSETAKSKLTAGLLGILLGGMGIHNFYLGNNTIGIIQVVLFVVGFLTIFLCGIGFLFMMAAQVWGLVEGIMILTGKITKDASGNLLKD